MTTFKDHITKSTLPSQTVQVNDIIFQRKIKHAELPIHVESDLKIPMNCDTMDDLLFVVDTWSDSIHVFKDHIQLVDIIQFRYGSRPFTIRTKNNQIAIIHFNDMLSILTYPDKQVIYSEEARKKLKEGDDLGRSIHGSHRLWGAYGPCARAGPQ